MRALFAAALAALVLVLAGCGDDPGGDGAEEGPIQDTGAAATPAPTEPTAPEQPAEAEGGNPKDLEKKPRVDIPKGDPPKKLVSQDIVEGKGKAAKKGDTVSVQYVGVLFDGGKQFDASWDRGEPFEFELGAGMVIPGWDEGVAGMKVGGRRKLVIPPDQAYGPQGQPPDIPPNATLVFVIDLKKVE